MKGPKGVGASQRTLWFLVAWAAFASVAAHVAMGQYLQVAQQVQPWPTGTNSSWLPHVVADVDLNGWPDFLTEDLLLGAVIVYLNPGLTGFGSFQSYDPSPCCAGTGLLSVGLVNQDPYPDVVQGGGSILKLLLNSGNGTFQTFVDLSAVVGSTTVYRHFLADLNGDGLADLILQRNGPSAASMPTFEVWVNNYPSWVLTWSAGAPFLPNSTGHIVGVADLNSDGSLDLVAEYGGSSLQPNCSWCTYTVVYLGSGTGTFGPAHVFDAAGGAPQELVDMDHDGLTDVLLLKSVQTNETLSIQYGHPTQILEPISTVATIVPYLGVGDPFAADVDGDGYTDIVMRWGVPQQQAPMHVDQHLGIIRGTGPRTYSPTLWDVLTTPWPHSFKPCSARDLDKDGYTDIVGLPEGSDLYYLRNNATFGTGCLGSGSSTPSIAIGSPTIGNPLFNISLSGALASAPAILGVSMNKTPLTGCGLGLDTGSLILPMGAIGTVTTSPQGAASLFFPLPANPALIGFQAYAQWGVLDPNGAFVSNGVHVALSQARTVILRD